MSAPPPPNLLFLFPDQWRWDWLGCHGTEPVRTPSIDALTSRGVRFTQCRCNSPLCAPSRASMVTGLRMHRVGVPDNRHDLDPSSRTYLQLLRDAGYSVAASGKTDLQKRSTWRGLDGWTPQLGELGFTHAVNQSGKWDAVKTGWPTPQDPYMAHLHQAGLAETHVEDYAQRMAARKASGKVAARAIAPSPLPRQHYTDDFCGACALRLLETLPAGRPWHLWVNFPGPHEPFDPPAELARRYDGVRFSEPVDPAPGVDHQHVRRHYAAMIEGIDEWVGRIIDAVRQRGELDNTIVVFSSDHGEMLGDHQRFNKSLWYEGAVHVPLIVAGPGVVPGASDALVELVDVAATLLDLAGVPAPDDWDARSFAPILRGQNHTPHRRYQLCQLYDWRMAFDGRWKLVGYDDGRRLLFDLADDPHELRDLAANRPREAERLLPLLDELKKPSQKSLPFPRGGVGEGFVGPEAPSPAPPTRRGRGFKPSP